MATTKEAIAKQLSAAVAICSILAIGVACGGTDGNTSRTSPEPTGVGIEPGHSLAIRQLYRGEEVGRITWQIRSDSS